MNVLSATSDGDSIVFQLFAMDDYELIYWGRDRSAQALATLEEVFSERISSRDLSEKVSDKGLPRAMDAEIIGISMKHVARTVCSGQLKLSDTSQDSSIMCASDMSFTDISADDQNLLDWIGRRHASVPVVLFPDVEKMKEIPHHQQPVMSGENASFTQYEWMMHQSAMYRSQKLLDKESGLSRKKNSRRRCPPRKICCCVGQGYSVSAYRGEQLLGFRNHKHTENMMDLCLMIVGLAARMSGVDEIVFVGPDAKSIPCFQMGIAERLNWIGVTLKPDRLNSFDVNTVLSVPESSVSVVQLTEDPLFAMACQAQRIAANDLVAV